MSAGPTACELAHSFVFALYLVGQSEVEVSMANRDDLLTVLRGRASATKTSSTPASSALSGARYV